MTKAEKKKERGAKQSFLQGALILTAGMAVVKVIGALFKIGRTVRRLMSYVARYRLRLMLVVLCIILSAVASVLSSTFIGVLIDDYISPLLLQANPVFTGLARALGVMVCVYVVGMISGYFYNRLMVTVAQGVLKDVRDEM